ncbi:MAG: purine-binding chemotaxis protein CheW [Verrucomicrobia bacterium]|nr:MAG: purine-binding chemotaxis protein CheW [Verrucomicrobiota bacterium]
MVESNLSQMMASKQFATFTLNSLFLGVDVLKVQEVIRYQTMTRVPTAPAMVEGLINLRGQIITAIDLRLRLDLPPRPEDQLPMNVVIRTDDGALSLLVDEIGDVVEIADGSFERIPETVTGVVRDLVTGVYKLEGKLLLILDTEKAANLPMASALTLVSAKN